MFILNEKTIGIPLDSINLITLTFYSDKSEILNIYDTNFEFNENIVPLFTSILETKPNIIQAKKYTNIDSESFIIINAIPNTITNVHTKSSLEYPCFFYDVQNNKNVQNIQGYTRKLINTLDTTIDINTIYDTSNNDLLVRMYNLESKKGEFGNCILNESEYTIILWDWEYANFQIIINKQTPEQCQIQLNIYITEDNTIISNKLEHINTIIQNINKIKNIMISKYNYS
jgi:hypothetical protein